MLVDDFTDLLAPGHFGDNEHVDLLSQVDVLLQEGLFLYLNVLDFSSIGVSLLFVRPHLVPQPRDFGTLFK